jgi:hypothetical protein
MQEGRLVSDNGAITDKMACETKCVKRITTLDSCLTCEIYESQSQVRMQIPQPA